MAVSGQHGRVGSLTLFSKLMVINCDVCDVSDELTGLDMVNENHVRNRDCRANGEISVSDCSHVGNEPIRNGDLTVNSTKL